MNGTKFAFTESQLNFLNSYRPQNNMFTSVEECELVIDVLGLKKLSLYDMVACRNAVVQFYTDKLDLSLPNDCMQSMMSVTAVIDHYSRGLTA